MVEEAIFINENNSSLLKKAIAKTLCNRSIDQLKISEFLNISQPMVSNYCNSSDKIPLKILNLAEKISEKILSDQFANFHTCIFFSDKNYEGNY